MVKIYKKGDEEFESKFEVAVKKFGLNFDEIELVFFDKFLFSYIFLAAVANRNLYLISTDNKKPEQISISEIKELLIDKKTDLNLYLKNGRVINLTSVVGVKPKVVRTYKELAEQLKKLR